MNTGTDAPTAAAGGPASEPDRPTLRLVRGSADGSDVAVELAALVAVLAARSSGEPEPAPLESLWAAPGSRLRRPFAVRPDGWRRSAFPV